MARSWNDDVSTAELTRSETQVCFILNLGTNVVSTVELFQISLVNNTFIIEGYMLCQMVKELQWVINDMECDGCELFSFPGSGKRKCVFVTFGIKPRSAVYKRGAMRLLMRAVKVRYVGLLPYRATSQREI